MSRTTRLLVSLATLVSLGIVNPAWGDTTTTLPITTTTWTFIGPSRTVWPSLVSSAIWHKVMRVHICEEGNGRGSWHINGSTYAGGLGWMLATWAQWRRHDFPLSAANATPQQQAWAMQRFVAHAMGGWWPDQPHCTGGY